MPLSTMLIGNRCLCAYVLFLNLVNKKAKNNFIVNASVLVVQDYYLDCFNQTGNPLFKVDFELEELILWIFCQAIIGPYVLLCFKA